MKYYKKRKKKSKRKTTEVKSANIHIINTPTESQQLEVAGVGKLRSFNLPLDEVMENISALSYDIERILGIDDQAIVLFAGDTKGEPRDEAGETWKMDEAYCKEHEFYVEDAEGGRRRIRSGDYGLIIWDMRQIDLWTLFVVCHELRHIWQMENGFAVKWEIKKCELDADAFAVSVSNFLYGCSMMHNEDVEYMAPDNSDTFTIEPEAVLKRAEMLDEEVSRAFREAAIKRPLNIDNDKYVWSRLVEFD